MVESKAGLARFLGVTRARVTQLMKLDKIAAEVWTWLAGSPAMPYVSERVLRELARKPAKAQLHALKTWCSWLPPSLMRREASPPQKS